MSRKLVWFSCGAASAVTAKLATDKYHDCEILYCDTLAYEHKDNIRFLNDISEWIGKEIKILKSDKYTDIYDVFKKTGWLIGPSGARCTTELKKNVRKQYQKQDDLHFFGLTYDEQKRIDKFEENNSELNLEWILDDFGVSKNDCYKILNQAGIELPTMYKLGYNNNNCIGCVKGQSGYWNKIRIDFPESFKKMAQQERRMNVAINKSYSKQIKLIDGTIIENPEKERVRVFLDELDPKAGRDIPLPDIECGVLCVNDPVTQKEAQDQYQMKFN